MRGPAFEEIWSIAVRAIQSNIVTCAEGRFLTAGGHQYRTIRVRDFCLSSPALLYLNEEQLVREHLIYFLKHQRKDGLIAKCFDVVNPIWRIRMSLTPLRWTERTPIRRLLSYKKKMLRPKFHGEHDTIAADSNLLVLNAILDWTLLTNKMDFFEHFAPQMQKLGQFITRQKRDGLLYQPGYSDWQDSARREGARSYLNILYLLSLHKIRATIDIAPRQVMGLWPDLTNQAEDSARAKAELDNEIKETTLRLWDVFFDDKANLFRDGVQSKQYSLEANLWCIEHGLFKNFVGRSVLWDALKNSPLFKQGPGMPIYPPYPLEDVSWAAKTTLLSGYHDKYLWSWLLAETLKVAFHVGDNGAVRDLLITIEEMTLKHQMVAEIYNRKLSPINTLLYKAESPFTLGAAKVIEALYLLR